MADSAHPAGIIINVVRDPNDGWELGGARNAGRWWCAWTGRAPGAVSKRGGFTTSFFIGAR
ncbi:MAG: hypothetical protein OEO19_09495 [Gammaproteobacteria bacterium]|nr:hypothetical protein [Gammaproteobacteria bacterium]